MLLDMANIKMLIMKNKNIEKYADIGIRLVVGLIFALAGYGKLFASPGIAGFSGMLAGIGLPVPTFWAYLVGVIELVGGIMMVAGIFTWVVAPLLAFIMLVAIFTVHTSGFSDFRYPLLLLVVCLRYIGTPGYFNLSDMLKSK